MNYYGFNREIILKNASDKIIIKVAKKAATYYRSDTEVLRGNARNKYKNLSEKGKDKAGDVKEKDIP